MSGDKVTQKSFGISGNWPDLQSPLTPSSSAPITPFSCSRGTTRTSHLTLIRCIKSARTESEKRMGKLNEKIKNTGIRRVEQYKYNEKRTSQNSYNVSHLKELRSVSIVFGWSKMECYEDGRVEANLGTCLERRLIRSFTAWSFLAITKPLPNHPCCVSLLFIWLVLFKVQIWQSLCSPQCAFHFQPSAEDSEPPLWNLKDLMTISLKILFNFINRL